MNILPDLIVMLPELVLAVGAMVLLLAGAIGGEKTAPAVSWAAIGFLAAATDAGFHLRFHVTHRLVRRRPERFEDVLVAAQRVQQRYWARSPFWVLPHF